MLRKIAIPELLFNLYFWGVVMLRPFLQDNLNESTLILTLFVFVLLCGFLVYAMVNRDQRVELPVVVMGLTGIIFFADAVFRVNSRSFILLYEFIYFGVVPVVLLSKVRQVKILLTYFSYFAVAAFFIYGIDPLNGYAVFSDYMGYGYKLALPAFLGIFIGFHYLRIKWMIVFEVIAFLFLMMFANRSALLTAVTFICLYILISHSFSWTRVVKRAALFIALFIVAYLNIDDLMNVLFQYTSEANFRNYAIQKLNYFLTSGSADEAFFSGRIQIWKQAIDMFLDQPVIGHGAGKFQDVYGYYPHNMILDVLVTSGLCGLIVVVWFLFRSVNVLLRSAGELRIFSLLLLALWFPKLLFSMMFVNDTAFWAFFVLFLFPFVKYHAKSERYPGVGLVGDSRNFG